MADQEEWRDVVGWEGLYAVSNHGNVYSKRLGRQLAKRPLPTGYLRVGLHRDGDSVEKYVHVLVAEAFWGDKPESGEVRHLNGVNTDNRAANLQWGTRTENALDRVRHGTNLNAIKEACPRGHLYDDQNTYNKKALGRNGNTVQHRQCRACTRAASYLRRRGLSSSNDAFNQIADQFYLKGMNK